jgi:hypothetical protein
MPRLLTGIDHPALSATEYALLYGGVRSYYAPTTKSVKQKDGTFTARPSSLSSRSLMKEMGAVFICSFLYEWVLTYNGINASLPEFPSKSSSSTQRSLSQKQAGENADNGSLNTQLDNGSQGVQMDQTSSPDGGNLTLNTGED